MTWLRIAFFSFFKKEFPFRFFVVVVVVVQNHHQVKLFNYWASAWCSCWVHDLVPGLIRTTQTLQSWFRCDYSNCEAIFMLLYPLAPPPVSIETTRVIDWGSWSVTFFKKTSQVDYRSFFVTAKGRRVCNRRILRSKFSGRSMVN